ncbi:MAG: ATP-grasp domain-containing protein [Deltaproteobacteria bacterium]|nr:ATP-grasp domain-containing protein [Deltaproteobacteria bacterium]
MKRNILVPCGGKWVGAIMALKAAQAEVPELAGGSVFVADREALTPAGCFADGNFVVPSVADEDYIDALLSICERADIRVIVPLIDIDLDRQSPHLARFEAIGTTVVTPPEHLVQLCLDKNQFDAFCEEEGLPVPRRVHVGDLASASFPLFGKRLRGFGSIGAGVVKDAAEARAMEEVAPSIFQEVIDAEEVSVDVFINRDGKLIARVPRQRDKVIGGEAQRSHTLTDPAVLALADRTAEALARRGLRGPANIQLFLSDPLTLIEVNTRLGSCTVLSNAATGGRIYRSVLLEACGGTAEGDPDDYNPKLHIYRFTGDVFYEGESMVSAAPPVPERGEG